MVLLSMRLAEMRRLHQCLVIRAPGFLAQALIGQDLQVRFANFLVFICHQIWLLSWKMDTRLRKLETAVDGLDLLDAQDV